MNIDTLFAQGKTVLSFEIFPPKRDKALGDIYETLNILKSLTPNFISVTFGAGGTSTNTSTCAIANIIKNEFDIEPLVHLTCINSSREEISETLCVLEAHGLKNILALRGDRNPNAAGKNDFAHASDLISFIRSQGDFHISAACYPEGHIEAKSVVDDILFLEKKVDSGASHLISQLFFDNSYFYAFLERASIAGISVPIEAGIMPVINKNQIERMVSLCGATLPEKFQRMVRKYENHPDALRDAGIAYAVDQIVDLMSHNVDGIHLYTMNNPHIARKISEGIASLIRV